jgi:hypothetical protein
VSDDVSLIDVKTSVVNTWLTEGVPGFAAPTDTYTLRLGDRPFARSVKRLFELKKMQLPPEIEVLKGDTYLITLAVGLSARSGANRVKIIGFTAKFDGPGATIDLFPKSEFKEYFAIAGKFEAGVSADGYAKVPDAIGALTFDVINLGANAELKLAAEANMVGKLSLSLKSPVVQAIGTAASTVEWQFHRDQTPLVGDQVMVQTVVVPVGQKELTYTLGAHAVIDSGPFSRLVRFESAPVVATVSLS